MVGKRTETEMENLSHMEKIKGRPMLVWMLALLCFFAWPVSAQVNLSTDKEKTEIREGNKQFEKDNYADAEANYKKALEKKDNMPQAVFNLGDAVYKQKRYDEAIKQFQISALNNPDSNVKAQAYHNIGNAYLEQARAYHDAGKSDSTQAKLQDAIKSYKESLKINPADKDTKYNLAYANAMIEKEKNDQKKNKDQDKKDKDKKDDKKDQQNQKPDSKPEDKPGDKKKDQQGKNDQQKSGGQEQMTKAKAEQLLQALKDEEQKTNQKVLQKQVKPSNVKIQKDW
jgi:Ca-activated chloride channel homolog